MFFIKYSWINILRNKKNYIPLFFIFVLLLLILIYAFSIRKNALIAYDKDFKEQIYGVAITTKSDYYNANSIPVISEELAKKYALSNYVIDYYTLEEIYASSDTVKPTYPSMIEYIGDNFNLAAYSDISKSLEFISGKRILVEGNYARNPDECNISIDLAQLNNFTVGSTFILQLWKNKNVKFTVVGLYSNATSETGSEFDFLIPDIDKKTGTRTFAGNDSIRCNDILTVTGGNHTEGWLKYKTAFYYMSNEQTTHSFRESVNRILPTSFTMLDSLGTIQFKRQLINGIENSYLWVLIISGIICSIFFSLLIFHIFKSRIYDIGVLRARGLSRKNTARLLSCEIFITSITALLVAGIIYYFTFISLTELLYFFQRNHINNVMWYDPAGISVEIANTVLDYKFHATLSSFELICGFIMSVVFTVLIGTASVSYIARNEPMQIMNDL